MNKKMMLVSVVVLLEIILAVISYYVLPDTLVMQITTSGEAGNTLPKLAGLAIPLFITILFSVLYYIHENMKHLLVAAIGIVMSILMLLFNL